MLTCAATPLPAWHECDSMVCCCTAAVHVCAGLARSAAATYAPHHICINCVAPGLTATPPTACVPPAAAFCRVVDTWGWPSNSKSLPHSNSCSLPHSEATTAHGSSRECTAPCLTFLPCCRSCPFTPKTNCSKFTGDTLVADASRQMHPLKQLATADEVAAALEFFLRPDVRGGVITGQVLAVDGGLSMLHPHHAGDYSGV